MRLSTIILTTGIVTMLSGGGTGIYAGSLADAEGNKSVLTKEITKKEKQLQDLDSEIANRFATITSAYKVLDREPPNSPQIYCGDLQSIKGFEGAVGGPMCQAIDDKVQLTSEYAGNNVDLSNLKARRAPYEKAVTAGLIALIAGFFVTVGTLWMRDSPKNDAQLSRYIQSRPTT